MVFLWRLSDKQFSQVFRTLLCILADINNTVVWMVLACPPISNTSSPLNKPLRDIPTTPITIIISITFLFHKPFSSLARSKHFLNFFFHLPLSASNIPKYLQFFHFSECSDSFLNWQFYSFWFFSLFQLFSTAHFSMPNSIPISWRYILIVSTRIFITFSFFCKQLDVVQLLTEFWYVIFLVQWRSSALYKWEKKVSWVGYKTTSSGLALVQELRGMQSSHHWYYYS